MSELTLSPIMIITLVISLTLVFWGVFSYLEWRKSIRFLTLRLLALFIVTLCIVLFILDPTYSSEIQAESIALLTPDYSPKTADSLFNQNLKFVRIENVEDFSKSTELRSNREILSKKKEIKAL